MNIHNLTRAQKADAVETLAAAFHDYPVMRFVLKTYGAEYETELRALVGFFCEARFAKDGAVLGIRSGDSFAAIALVDEAIQKPWPAMKSELIRLKNEIGHEAFSRLELYERLSSGLEPQDPHYFLGMIGVLPEHHGKGYGRALLDRVKEMSVADPRSAGVCLSTENPNNVPLYERFGYRIIGEVDIEEMHSWCMFLPT